MVSVNTEKLPPTLLQLFLKSTRRYGTLHVNQIWMAYYGYAYEQVCVNLLSSLLGGAL